MQLYGMGLNPCVGSRFSAPVQIDFQAHPAPCQWAQVFFPEGKAARVGLSWPVLGLRFGTLVAWSGLCL